jgi:murein DD-endopeptidase MepM/ murein hydrolase activator NlpD
MRSFYLILLLGLFSGCAHQETRKDKTPHRPAKPPVVDTDKRTIALSWPVDKGVVFRTFDQTPSRLHEGLSIGAPVSTPVRAAQSGEVLYAAQASNHLGRMILIKHKDPFVSIYGHLDTMKVKVGQMVLQGEVIGTMGTSGGVESPRVYFELRKDRMPVNPEPYFSKPG